ncbi:MAG: class I SAM-dependent methyltransferase [Desulfomonile tiedjei]|uniref:Class I SAM-dependent methyltransferase n=1 Tax=Desulfomonile tiedjei TaxID=2358 RepID=A0A9D6V778_9BACT|nr:class I SAM-dependent methyltransferase [Desulfomonile tiedjei]
MPGEPFNGVAEKLLPEIMLENVTARLVEPHIYSVYAQAENMGSYDKTGGIYDVVACNRFYNRVVWGYWTSDYHFLCQEALKSATSGWVLDAGCGSLAFTAKTYATYSERPIVLLDQSIRLLRMAKKRLIQLNGCVPPNMVFLHGDALDMPFRPKTFNTIISMNLLHVFSDVKNFLCSIGNISAEESTLRFTTLVLNNRLSDTYLRALETAGAVVARTLDEISEIFDDAGIPVKCIVRGNLGLFSHNASPERT